MEIIELTDKIEVEGCTSLALGFFDGIHIGHKRILEKARDLGIEKDCKSGILTFKVHPLEVLRPGFHFHYLTTIAERKKIVQSLGLDYFLMLPFTREIAATSPEDFVENILWKKLHARYLVTGKDYSFGKNGKGNVALLRKMLEPRGVEIHVISDISLDNKRVGSTNIRNSILSGLIDDANRSLGRWYSLEGEVVKGKRRGRTIGVPTANLNLPIDKVLPPQGVYCVLVLYEGKLYRGVGNVGNRPTFEEYQPNIEIHLLNFNGEIYGEKIRVFFIHGIREIIHFDSAEDLVKRIKEDIDCCRGFFENISREDIERNFKCCPGVVEGNIEWIKKEFTLS